MKSIQEAVPDRIILREFTSNTFITDAHWVFWLSRNKFSQASNQNHVILQEIPSTDLLIHVNEDTWQLTKRLNEDVALKENLPVQLAKLFFPARCLWDAAAIKDRRSLNEGMAWAKGDSGKATSLKATMTTPGDPLLILLIGLILFIERVTANNRNQ